MASFNAADGISKPLDGTRVPQCNGSAPSYHMPPFVPLALSWCWAPVRGPCSGVSEPRCAP